MQRTFPDVTMAPAFSDGADVSRKNEKFKARMREKQARADRLYRLALMSVALGLGIVCFGASRM
jgi:hypothetical protein